MVQIASGVPDLHSGVEGGAATEPMFDMYVNDLCGQIRTHVHPRIRLLATLMGGEGKVAIPDFCSFTFTARRSSLSRLRRPLQTIVFAIRPKQKNNCMMYCPM